MRHVHSVDVTERCGDFKSASTNYQLGPMRKRSDYKEATERITSFAIREGRSVEHIPKEERHRIDALDPDLETWLIWLSENWHNYFANDGITIKLRFIYFLELQLLDWKFQVVLEWRRLERPQMVTYKKCDDNKEGNQNVKQEWEQDIKKHEDVKEHRETVAILQSFS